MDYGYDLIVIGAGSGGVACARRAASHGAKVAIVEESRVGGTCVLRGCVPKKLLMYAAHYGADLQDMLGYGWQADNIRFDWPTLIRNKNTELDRLNGLYTKMLADSGVTVLQGRGVLIAPHTVAIAGKTYTAQQVLIATGARPYVPPLSGIEQTITSDDALDLPVLPRSIAILGAGYIALEFASLFCHLGVETHLFIRHDRPLRDFDAECVGLLTETLLKAGLKIHTHAKIQAVGSNVVVLENGESVTVDHVLNATGRRANTQNLGLESLDVQLDAATGAIIVDDKMCSNVPWLYAVGDVTDQLNLTPYAIRQGRALAENLFNKKNIAVNLPNVPTAVFTSPAFASVGLSEEQAIAAGHQIDVYAARFRPMKFTLAQRQQQVLLKMVVDTASDVVLGMQMVGDDAPEIIQMAGIALTAGATKAMVDATLAVHPTTAEEFVLLNTKRAA